MKVKQVQLGQHRLGLVEQAIVKSSIFWNLNPLFIQFNKKRPQKSKCLLLLNESEL